MRSKVALVHPKGPLQMGPDLEDLRQVLEEALRKEETRIAMNLSQVPRIDSSGIGLLVLTMVSAKKARRKRQADRPSRTNCEDLAPRGPSQSLRSL